MLHVLLVVCLGWCFDYLFGLDVCYAGLFDDCVCLVAGFSAEFVVGVLLCCLLLFDA